MSEASLFAPGESPFRAKGMVYRSSFESTELRVPGGKHAVLERLDDPKLRAFLEQPFLAASAYDILPLVPFGMVAANIVGIPYSEYVRRGAEFVAGRDLHGVYKLLLKVASPDAVVKRLPRILRQYFTFGTIEGSMTGPRCYEGHGSGFPEPLLVWIFSMARGFVPVLMEAAGAKNINFVLNPREREGEEFGVTLYRNSFKVTWDL